MEEGLESVLTHKHSRASARKRIFDGAAEAKLVAVACSAPPKGRARWTLKLLETAVVELNIVDRASDNTIGRTLKKYAQASPQKAMGYPAEWVSPSLPRRPRARGIRWLDDCVVGRGSNGNGLLGETMEEQPAGF